MSPDTLGLGRDSRGLPGMTRVVRGLRGRTRVVGGGCRGTAALTFAMCILGATVHAQPAAPSAAKTVQVNRAARDAWSPIM